MRIVIAGAFGNLGRDVLKAAVAAGHDVLAIDRVIRPTGFKGYDAREIDVRNPEALAGICDGADIVVTTVGLTTKHPTLTHYDIDLDGNRNLLTEASRAGVKKFVYVSVLKVDSRPDIPMLDAKHQFEELLKASGIPYIIFRPTGYFYDIAKVFMPMIEKGRVNLLKGVSSTANVVDTADFGEYIVNNMNLMDMTVEVGGKETYTYEEIAGLFFKAAGKPVDIRYAPTWLFDVLGFIARLKHDGSYANVKFGKWTLENDMSTENRIGSRSFSDYVSTLYVAGKAH